MVGINPSLTFNPEHPIIIRLVNMYAVPLEVIPPRQNWAEAFPSERGLDGCPQAAQIVSIGAAGMETEALASIVHQQKASRVNYPKRVKIAMQSTA